MSLLIRGMRFGWGWSFNQFLQGVALLHSATYPKKKDWQKELMEKGLRFAEFYDDGENQWLDHSPEVFGLEIIEK